MKFQILYGIENNYKDVTRKALLTTVSGTHIHIPKNDNQRASIFGDHIYGILKHILLKTDEKTQIYDDNTELILDISNELPLKNDWFDNTITDPLQKLEMIHNNIICKHGDIKDEFPEQIMSATFIEKHNRVLHEDVLHKT